MLGVAANPAGLAMFKITPAPARRMTGKAARSPTTQQVYVDYPAPVLRQSCLNAAGDANASIVEP